MKFLDNSRTGGGHGNNPPADQRVPAPSLDRPVHPTAVQPSGHDQRRPASRGSGAQATVRPAAFGERGGNVASDAAVDWLLTAEERPTRRRRSTPSTGMDGPGRSAIR